VLHKAYADPQASAILIGMVHVIVAPAPCAILFMGANLIRDQRTSDTSEVRPGQMFNYASTLLLRQTNRDLYETHLHASWSVAGLLMPDVPLSEAASANLPALALYETTKAINRARSKGKLAELIALRALPRVIYCGRHSEARSFLG
jgi:hypothetical protein